MKRLILACSVIIGLCFSQSGVAQPSDLNKLSNQEIVARAPEIHPAALYILAARLLTEGKGQEAANRMYAGQLRYRILITATKQASGSSEMTLFNALSEQVGRPVNEYVAGDPDEWIAAIDWALGWDEKIRTPLSINARTPQPLKRCGPASLNCARRSIPVVNRSFAKERKKAWQIAEGALNMLRPTRILSLTLCLLFHSPVLAADESTLTDGRLAVGKTGIYCMKKPCPWRGIVDLADNTRKPLMPLRSNSDLPRLVASAEDAKRLLDAWPEHGCLAVFGAFDKKTLRVDKILGNCP